VVRQDPVESHLPERAARRVAALAPDGPALWRRGRPRPLRLFAHPEAVEAVALLPDHPPARFRWRRVQHKVVRAEGPERIAPEWWLDDEDRAGAPARDYFRVEDEAGRRYWLYRAGGRWFIHGLFG
jgi:protein ImuB